MKSLKIPNRNRWNHKSYKVILKEVKEAFKIIEIS